MGYAVYKPFIHVEQLLFCVFWQYDGIYHVTVLKQIHYENLEACCLKSIYFL